MSMIKNFEIRMKGFVASSATLEIVVFGLLETMNTGQFRIETMEMINLHPNARRVSLDLENLNYISSTGIGTIVEIMSELGKKNVELILVRVPFHVKNVINLLGFTAFLHLE